MKTIFLSIVVFTFTSCDLIFPPVNKQSTFTPPEQPGQGKFVSNDSSFFKLKVLENKYEIDFLNNISIVNNLSDLDTFLQKNKKNINREKLVLTNFDTADSNLKSLLSKYDLTYFILSEEE